MSVSLLFLSSQDPVVTKGLSCLKSVIEDVKNTYTTALLAYTFSLAGDTDTRQQLFKKLDEVAILDGKRFVSDDFLLSFMTVLLFFVMLIELHLCLLLLRVSSPLVSVCIC